MHSHKLAAIVLCGGASRRMGRPKAWLPFGGQTLLQRMVDTVTSVCQPCLVVGSPVQSLPPLDRHVWKVPDTQPGQGPLEGLATGLERLRGTVERAFVTSCDNPLLTADVIRYLAGIDSHADAVVPCDSQHRYPLLAVYSVRMAGPARTLLDQGERRLLRLFDEVPPLSVPTERLRAVDPALQSLTNINDPEAYAAALRQAGFSPTTPPPDFST